MTSSITDTNAPLAVFLLEEDIGDQLFKRLLLDGAPLVAVETRPICCSRCWAMAFDTFIQVRYGMSVPLTEATAVDVVTWSRPPSNPDVVQKQKTAHKGDDDEEPNPLRGAPQFEPARAANSW
jgi:hypothetical protein